jgi:hypothetical protein
MSDTLELDETPISSEESTSEEEDFSEEEIVTISEDDLEDHIVTKEDMEMNPEFVKIGIEEGQTIQIPKEGVMSDELTEELIEEEDLTEDTNTQK